MTLMSSLTFVLPAEIIENKHDRIPNIALSFLVTIISSILKWGAWDLRCEETKRRADEIVGSLSAVKPVLGKLSKLIKSKDDVASTSESARETVTIKKSLYNECGKITEETIGTLNRSKEVLFSIKPRMVTDYEKRILESRMRKQNKEVTESFSRLFSRLLESYQMDARWDVERTGSDPAAEMKRLYRLDTFAQLVNDQRCILSSHSHMLQYASDYKRAMFGERMNTITNGFWYKFRTMLWCIFCHVRCLEPEDIPLGPKPLDSEIKTKSDRSVETQRTRNVKSAMSGEGGSIEELYYENGDGTGFC